nr:GDSL family lipase [Lachnospiraceae bacterium]
NTTKQKKFKKCYIKFLKKVRALNPYSHIMNAVGFFGGSVYDLVEDATKTYMKKTGDKNVSYHEIDPNYMRQDGYGGNGHPKEVSHDKAVKKLKKKIKKEMGW